MLSHKQVQVQKEDLTQNRSSWERETDGWVRYKQGRGTRNPGQRPGEAGEATGTETKINSGGNKVVVLFSSPFSFEIFQSHRKAERTAPGASVYLPLEPPLLTWWLLALCRLCLLPLHVAGIWGYVCFLSWAFESKLQVSWCFAKCLITFLLRPSSCRTIFTPRNEYWPISKFPQLFSSPRNLILTY